MTTQPLVQITDVRKYFLAKSGRWGRRDVLRAVDGVSLDIPEGSILGLVGESGCGKSTLGRIILRLLAADEGRIVFDGNDMTHLSDAEFRPLRAYMQIVFQDPYGSLNPRLPAREILDLPLRLHFQITRREREARARSLMGEVGLSPDWLECYPHHFSGGQRQRLCIARALAVRPRFVVADEPVAALDVSIQAQIINLLLRLKKERGLTYLFIAHDLAVVSQICDKIAVMHLGRIVEKGSRAQIIESPRHPYTQLLLGSLLEAKAPQMLTISGRSLGEMATAIDPPSGCRFHPRCPHVIKDVCQEEEPMLTDAGGAQFVACHHHKRGDEGGE